MNFISKWYEKHKAEQKLNKKLCAKAQVNHGLAELIILAVKDDNLEVTGKLLDVKESFAKIKPL